LEDCGGAHSSFDRPSLAIESSLSCGYLARILEFDGQTCFLLALQIGLT